ncbi:MAG: universal stress protein [Hyphomicrobiaceae bacterium]
MLYSSIVVGTDGSETASLAVSHAIDLAVLSGATLHIVTVGSRFVANVVGAAGMPAAGELDPNQLTEELMEVVNSAASSARARGAIVERHAVVGDVVQALCDVAKRVEADLLVVGNRGMYGFQRFFWESVPDTVSHNAPCSVLIVDTRNAQ